VKLSPKVTLAFARPLPIAGIRHSMAVQPRIKAWVCLARWSPSCDAPAAAQAQFR